MAHIFSKGLAHTTRVTEQDVWQLDEADPLASFRERFHIPQGGVYLDGNSLGVLPKATCPRIEQVVKQQWGGDLITSWNKHSWISLPQRIGAKLARLLGASEDELIAADSTSINVFKVVSAALDLRPDRTVIVSERGNFPTDLYMVEGLINSRGGRHQLVLLEDPRDLLAGKVDLSSAAVVLLTHVSYRTGRVLDMKAITSAVHQGGAMMAWDLAHSAGAVPVNLNEAGADFAVGCGYKYLNGGPGAPAFLYVAKRHQATAQNPLSGWMGHQMAFAFENSYRPADSISRFLCGTPPIISLAALEVGVDLMLEADQQQLRKKSKALGELFLQLLHQECGEYDFCLFSPPDSEERGSQVNICHEHGFAIVQALLAKGVTGDFRTPDIMRFGFTPLYTRFLDVWLAIQALKQVMQKHEWACTEFQTRHAVT